jgi:hypothetical protein
MRNVSDKRCIKTKHILCSTILSESRAVYKIMWKNIEPDRPWMKLRGMRISCWIVKAKKTHTHTHTWNMQYLLLFHCNNGYAKEPQRYLDTYIACLVAFRLGESTDIQGDFPAILYKILGEYCFLVCDAV